MLVTAIVQIHWLACIYHRESVLATAIYEVMPMYPVGSLSLSVHCSTKIISQVPTISINVLNPTITTSNILTTPSLLYVHGCSLLSPLNSLNTRAKIRKSSPRTVSRKWCLPGCEWPPLSGPRTDLFRTCAYSGLILSSVCHRITFHAINDFPT